MGKVSAKKARGKEPKRLHIGKHFLGWNAEGGWCKRINGKLHYFGKDDNRAIHLWQQFGEALLAGDIKSIPKDGATTTAELTLAELVNRFLAVRRQEVENGSISPRTYEHHVRTGRRLAKHIGGETRVATLGPSDFTKLALAINAELSPIATKNEITRIKQIFKWGWESALMTQAVRFGPDFKTPKAKAIRRQRNRRAGGREYMFEPQEIHAMLAACDERNHRTRHYKAAMKAAVLLGANCGFGPDDCASLTWAMIDGDELIAIREKTEERRHAILWPETIDALEAWRKIRPTPANADDSELVFLTSRGTSWKSKDPKRCADYVQKLFLKVLKCVDFDDRGRRFYALRHGFQTVCDENDISAWVTKRFMGHTTRGNDIPAKYRERVPVDQLRRAAEAIHDWLF